jgi:hypothetical protein
MVILIDTRLEDDALGRVVPSTSANKSCSLSFSLPFLYVIDGAVVYRK